ncbi:unnamed protein product [Bursaphelenchus xylophilus]|uniref:(pine wood nematode) hypothetical protein n=1 Tax=Bursaphelenchus xylophilus TaxID=6326 RepID=A0A7I8WI92_BURXY|nr:unnamed protein product [Bursaphelenchus xylophilus]CAG9108998.1 unnamed protein product [Bursaphelenchus xylophilus]
MLPVLPDDLLLRLLSFCEPDDVNNFCLLDKRSNEFVQNFRWHLPRQDSNCIVRIDANDNVYIKMSPATVFSINQRCKKFVFSPRSKPLDDSVFSAYNIHNLAIIGTHSKVCKVTPSLTDWIQLQLNNKNIPQLQHISLKYLDFSSLSYTDFSKLFEIIGINGKVSIKNCIFPVISMIYDVFLQVGKFEYVVENGNTIKELDYNVEEMVRLTENVLDTVISGCSTKLDLSSLVVPSVGVIVKFIQKWRMTREPNDFSQLSFQFLPNKGDLTHSLLQIPNAKTVAGTNVVSINNNHDPTSSGALII